MIKIVDIKRWSVALLCLLLAFPVLRGADDSTAVTDSLKTPYRFRPLQLIVPVTLIGVGVIGLESDWLKGHDNEVKEELQERPHPQVTIDDFTQFAPLAALYGLKLCGVKGRHDYVDMTIIAGTAYLLTGVTVFGLKTITAVERPDGKQSQFIPFRSHGDCVCGSRAVAAGILGRVALDWCCRLCCRGRHGLFPHVQQPPLAHRCLGRCRSGYIERTGGLLALSRHYGDIFKKEI